MGLAKALPVIYLICIVLAAILVYTYLCRTTKSINQNVLYYPAFKTGINEIPYKVYKSSIILIYTNFWGQATWSYFENYKRNCKCNLEYCEISYSKDNLKSADVVLFHGHPTDLLSYQKLQELNHYENSTISNNYGLSLAEKAQLFPHHQREVQAIYLILLLLIVVHLTSPFLGDIMLEAKTVHYKKKKSIISSKIKQDKYCGWLVTAEIKETT